MKHDFLPAPVTDKEQSADEIQKHLESFAAFDRWMDEKLDELVAAWIHTAAPNAERASRGAKVLGR
jgi:hypothetical protein